MKVIRAHVYEQNSSLYSFLQQLSNVPAPVKDITMPTMFENNDNASLSTEGTDDQELRVLASIFHHSSFRGKQE